VGANKEGFQRGIVKVGAVRNSKPASRSSDHHNLCYY